MAGKSEGERLVDAQALEDLTAHILETVGVPQDEALLVADALVSADVRGNNSHGVLRLPVYVSRIRSGGIQPGHKGQVLRETEATLLLDGQDGIGQVIAARAMTEAVRKAKAAGAGIVGVRCSNHFGEAAFYVLQAVREGMIGVITTNGSPNLPLWGSFSKLVGNIPVAIGIPSGTRHPIVLDMALGAVARGKFMYAASKGARIPLDWGVDAQGEPTDDPQAVLDGGWPPPIGKYKGSGLMLVAEVLAGVLTGAEFADSVGNMYGDPAQPQGLGHFAVAIDVAAFMPLSEFKQRVDGLVALIKGSELAPGFDEILMPDEREFRLEEERRERGIPLSGGVLADLQRLTEELGIAYPLEPSKVD